MNLYVFEQLVVVVNLNAPGDLYEKYKLWSVKLNFTYIFFIASVEKNIN